MIAGLALLVALPLAASTPACHLDRARGPAVEATARQMVAAYRAVDGELPFHRVAVNAIGAKTKNVLHIEIVSDTPSACIVDGLCQAIGDEQFLIRCSAGGVGALAGKSEGRPALAYVLGHEIGHLLRRDQGLFLRDISTVSLAGTRAERLRVLKAGCDIDPNLAEEEAADAMALNALATLLQQPPYRQAMLNARGSLYWNVDEILLAADRLQKRSDNRFVAVHPLFDPDRHPSRSDAPFFEWAARRFVCDALTGSRGVVRYPLPASTHPAPEQRLRRIAERIDAMALAAEDDSTSRYQRRVGAETAGRLQQDVGAILNKLVEQEGEYLQALHGRVCSIANLDAAGLDCAGVSAVPPPEENEP